MSLDWRIHNVKVVKFPLVINKGAANEGNLVYFMVDISGCIRILH